jgi:hypothetical protein
MAVDEFFARLAGNGIVNAVMSSARIAPALENNDVVQFVDVEDAGVVRVGSVAVQPAHHNPRATRRKLAIKPRVLLLVGPVPTEPRFRSMPRSLCDVNDLREPELIESGAGLDGMVPTRQYKPSLRLVALIRRLTDCDCQPDPAAQDQ